MYIRRIKKQRSKKAKAFYQYSLAQTYRQDGKVKQKVILYLGSDKRLDDKTIKAQVLEILKSKIFKQPALFPTDVPQEIQALAEQYFEKYCGKFGQDDPIDYRLVSTPPLEEQAEFHNIDVKAVDLTCSHSFGGENLCKQILDKLALKKCLEQLGFNEKDVTKALISIAARALFAVSEYQTVQYLEKYSNLKACFHYNETISHKQLYRIADKLYAKQPAIDEFLYEKTAKLFNLKDQLVIFDLTNTYFQTSKRDSEIAKFGRCKSKRNDCPLVTFTGVINQQGFMRHSRIYPGNTADPTTLSDMIDDLENHTTAHRKIIVIDAGIASEGNLTLIQQKGYQYVCVSRVEPKDIPAGTSDKTITVDTDRGKQQVEIALFKPGKEKEEGDDDDGQDQQQQQEEDSETWMYVKSEQKRQKERSINEKLSQSFKEDLQKAADALHKKGGIKNIYKVWQRIGRIKEKHKRVSAHYAIEVEQKEELATAISWNYEPLTPTTNKQQGIYFIRTNIEQAQEKLIWDIYNTLRNVESTFRCLKTDLNVRPVYHQNDERIKSHIYLTLLAYQMVNTIRYMLKKAGIYHSWSTIVKMMSSQRMTTVSLSSQTKTIELRTPTQANAEQKQIYKACNCKATKPAIKKYVVYH